MIARLPVALIVAAGAATALSGCIVVPVDSRTGQPIGYANTRSAMAAAPTAPAAPLTITARLYPLNDLANRAGMLTATVVDKHGGRGTFSVSYLGDMLQGEATRVESGQRGVANGFGAKGVNAQCDYVITGPGIGTGACTFSDGAHYQMHFGG
jgi:hypothetical protein